MELEIADSERKVLEDIVKLEHALSKLSSHIGDLKLELDKELSNKDMLYSEHEDLYITLENIEKSIKDDKDKIAKDIEKYISIEKNGNGTPR